ncbi:DNA repair protein RecN [Enemella sp. A6]|uniref:DNA repair protein RecN n=1 Tax=Enemella sp. A6 TaxID=3440152 RepID=UPI003EBABE8F
MIGELRIRNLGVIADATIEPGPGLTVVTGETGAGKTMVVTGLGLLLGGKGSAGQVRNGTERLQVTGRFSQVGAEAVERVTDAGGELDEDELLVVRQVTAAGRSRAHLGGVAVPMAVAGDLVAEMLVIHGQTEQVRLARSDRQREVLDRFGGAELAAERDTYHRAWQDRRAAVTERDELHAASRERARELDLLRFGADEIAAVDPQPGEDEQLRVEANRLQSVDDLRMAAHTALVAINSDPDDPTDQPYAVGLLDTARTALDRADTDPEAADLARRVADLGYQLADLGADLSSFLAGLEADPNRLEWVTGRLAELSGLTRKYGESIDEVLAWAASAAERIAELDGTDDRIAALDHRIEALDTELLATAARLTALRRTAADELAAAVDTELAALAMPNATLSFELTSTGDDVAALGPTGADQVEIMFRANPGQRPGPLGAVASGGELSRIRLALEVSLADRLVAETGTGPTTMVFDEVDAGIGGRVASEVGRRLARLAEHAQVIVVTHLAQVAAFAGRHYCVAKTDDGQVTVSDVAEVTGDDRLAELARMLGGADSDAARAHAAELLAQATVSDPVTTLMQN